MYGSDQACTNPAPSYLYTASNIPYFFFNIYTAYMCHFYIECCGFNLMPASV